jgi:hypothetical protein
MADYIKVTNFSAKDALSTGDPLKKVRGTEINDELVAIATSIATKADKTSPSITGSLSATGNVTAGGSVTGTTVTATGAVTGATVALPSTWTIEVSGGKLVFKHNNISVASLTSAGVFTVLTDVQGYTAP